MLFLNYVLPFSARGLIPRSSLRNLHRRSTFPHFPLPSSPPKGGWWTVFSFLRPRSFFPLMSPLFPEDEAWSYQAIPSHRVSFESATVAALILHPFLSLTSLLPAQQGPLPSILGGAPPTAFCSPYGGAQTPFRTPRVLGVCHSRTSPLYGFDKRIWLVSEDFFLPLFSSTSSPPQEFHPPPPRRWRLLLFSTSRRRPSHAFPNTPEVFVETPQSIVGKGGSVMTHRRQAVPEFSSLFVFPTQI